MAQSFSRNGYNCQMCGIAGFFSPPDGVNAFPNSEREAIAMKMGEALAHRGPDDFLVWQEPKAGVAFSFRRLAILDLSTNGRQPMDSSRGRYTLELNGEIYNYLELKKELETSGKFSSAFRGHSDTEVLLAGFEVWGIEATLKKANGMFALAVWDRETQQLLLARDRMGEKPLYYGVVDGKFLFASELKALFATPGFRGTLDYEALALLFRYGYIPTPYSVFREIKKLTPGRWLRIDRQFQIKEGEFWSLAQAAAHGLSNPFAGTMRDAEATFETLLSDSIQKRRLSDVPLGAFLSGGIDSSLIVALMQKQSTSPVKTFTIGFEEAEYDESTYAAAVAAHLRTDHHAQKLNARETLDLIPTLSQVFDEPLGDASQIPTHLVSRCARQSVTVALSGDGGDELFAGYPRYAWGEKVSDFTSLIPAPLRSLMGQGLDAIPSRFWKTALDTTKELFPSITTGNNPEEKIRKLSELIKETNPREVYRTLVTQWPSPRDVIGKTEVWPGGRAAEIPPQAKHLIDQMMYWDQATYLCDDVLTKVDRASMAVGLEVRVPLLDHRVVELAWSFPKEWKLHGGVTKYLMRQVLDKHVPRALIERPKKGFSLPVEHWLRGELKDWAEDLLREDRLEGEALLSAAVVRKAWCDHRDGLANHQHALWTVLMFQSWVTQYRQFIKM